MQHKQRTWSSATLAVACLLALLPIGKAAHGGAPQSQLAAAAGQSADDSQGSESVTDDAEPEAESPSGEADGRFVSRGAMLVGSLTVFFLAVFVGFEVITKVPPTLHTPLMSGSNAISGITVVGAMLTAGAASIGLGSLLGMLALILATVNVVGGFLVTHRMLKMFQGSKK